MMLRLLILLPAVQIAVGVAACTAYPRWVPDGSAEYRDGYHDGCHSGALARSGAAGRIERKTKRKYRLEPEYRKGWDQARTYCEVNPVIAPYGNEPAEPGTGTMGGGEAAGK